MMRARAWYQRQAASWSEGKKQWRSTILRCPLFDADADAVDRSGGSGLAAAGRHERERSAALKARFSVAVVTSVLTTYVFVERMKIDDGHPYYFIYLTNWTGMISFIYVVLAAHASYVAHRQHHRHHRYRGFDGDGLVDGDDEGGAPSSSSSPPSMALVIMSSSSGSPPHSPVDAADAAAAAAPNVQVPFHIHALWAVKATAPVAQFVITIMFWGLLYRPEYGPVTALSVIAHGEGRGMKIFKYSKYESLAPVELSSSSTLGTLTPLPPRPPPSPPQTRVHFSSFFGRKQLSYRNTVLYPAPSTSVSRIPDEFIHPYYIIFFDRI